MTLVPISGIVGAVSKVHEQSPEAARMLVTLGVYESMLDQREDTWGEIGPDVLSKMADTLVVARTALIRGHVGKSVDEYGNTDDLVYAQGMAVLETHIEKGLTDILRGLFNRQHPRDSQGQWVKANVGANTTIGENEDPSKSQASLHSAARNKVDRWKSNGMIDDDTPLIVHHRMVGYRNKARDNEEGRVSSETTRANLITHLQNAESGGDRYLEEVMVDRDETTRGKDPKQRIAMDLMAGMMGGGAEGYRSSDRLMRGLPMDQSGKTKPQDDNAIQWNRPGSEGDRQSFRRMSMAGGFLSDISAPGSTMNSIGGFAQLVGNLGPEAEKVLGPGMRRTAYRYRGTEKRPDKALVNGVREATAAASSLDYDPSQRQDPAQQSRLNNARSGIVARANPRGALATSAGRGADRSTARPGTDKVAQTNHYWADKGGISEDFRAMGMRGDAAVVNMMDVLPDKTLTELGVASGELPPSTGVIINANGQVVSQAMGYNGDHYLPFDLKNLNALHGGQYVRTRAHGGPTTEDIYTGLLTGARQIQVVSNSGVFTVEFDPDLRGKRRYSDKAARMVSRYGKILETIVGGTVYQTGLSPQKLRDIRTDALGRSNKNPKLYQENVKLLTEQALLMGSVAGEDDDDEMAEGVEYAVATAINRQNKANKEAGRGPLSTSERGMISEETRVKFESDKAESVRKLKLDGPGYERALRTLRQEFPYYIRQAKWESLPDYLRERGISNDKEFRRFAPTDSGYVKPGQNHATRQELWSGISDRKKEAEEKAKTEAAQTPEQKAAAAATAATAGGRSSTGAKIKTIAEATGPDTPYMDTLSVAVGKSLAVFMDGGPIGVEYPDVSLTTDKQIVEGDFAAGIYTNWKFKQFKAGGADPSMATRKMAKWLAAPDTDPAWRIEALKGLSAAPKQIEDYKLTGFKSESVDENATLVKELIDLKFPFSKPAEGVDPALTELSIDNPKPVKYDDIPEVLGEEEYDKYLNGVSSTQQGFFDAVKEYESKHGAENEDGPNLKAIAIDVETTRKLLRGLDKDNAEDVIKSKVILEQLAVKQKALSFIKAKHVGKKLEKLSGGAAPLAKGLATAGRRKVTFHKADDQYSRRVRAHLGLPLE